MRAMELHGVRDLAVCREPLSSVERPVSAPGPGMVLIRVSSCGVCHTELDEIEGRTPPPRYPVIPGHQGIGRVIETGPGARQYAVGDRVGVGWFHSSCGACVFCRSGRENLCGEFRATGRDADGGYAEYLTVPESSAVMIPAVFNDMEAAPLLCAGAVGYRALRLTGMLDGLSLGLTGFGASGHLVLRMARHLFPSSPVCVFARSASEREFALCLGASWAGDTSDRSPLPLDCIIDTTPAWKPVLEALDNLSPGGRLVMNAIRKESRDRDELLRLDYARHLWLEKEVKSVANVCREDLREFLLLAEGMDLHPVVDVLPLAEANRALLLLKAGGLRGALVLVP
jgi:alcohol dehydrogenase, propanol-preferring